MGEQPRWVLAMAFVCATATAAEPDAAYRSTLDRWRAEREAGLRADGGWLTVTGLFWLKPGDNTLGSGADSAVRLPAHSSAPRIGRIALENGVATLHLDTGVEVSVSGAKAGPLVTLRPDSGGEPTVVAVGAAMLQVIQRSDRVGVRIKDMKSPRRAAFAGLSWFPIAERYRVEARWIPFAPPRQLEIANVIGTVEPMTSPGVAEFSWGGRTHRLQPVLEEPGATDLFFIFKDATAGHETYGAGRFLYAAMPKDGRVVLDFNKAYSPPCAFTDFATCPLPPKVNRLPIRVEAGEKAPAHH